MHDWACGTSSRLPFLIVKNVPKSHALGKDHHRRAGKAHPLGSGRGIRPGSRIPPGKTRPDVRRALEDGERAEAFQGEEGRSLFSLSPGKNSGGEKEARPGYARFNLDARKCRGVIPPITATSLRQAADRKPDKASINYERTLEMSL